MIQNDLQTKLIMMVLKHLSRNQPFNLLMYCTKKKGSQNTSLQYLRFLFCFFPPLRTTSLTPNVSVVVFWPCSIFGSGTFHYNLCQKPVKRRHNELFSAFVFFFILGKKKPHIQNVMTGVGCQSLYPAIKFSVIPAIIIK